MTTSGKSAKRMPVHKILTVLVLAGSLTSTACGDQSQSGFCGEYEEANAAFEDSDGSDPGALREALAELSPPEEIAADWELLGERWEEFSDVDDAEDVDGDPADLQAAEDLAQRSDEYNEALRNVRGYLRHECDVDLG